MDKEQINAALAKSKDISDKRNFKQSFDIIVNLKGLDLKKPEHQVDTFVTLPNPRGKKVKICALIGPELEEQSKGIFDLTIISDNFEKYRDKKVAKKIADSFDFFIAQANIMPKVATIFGKVLGPRGKMPNPKSGCIVAPNANLKPLYEKLQRTVRINTKGSPLIQCAIGAEDMSTDEIAENALTVYKFLLQALPNEKYNIKNICVKLTMGRPVIVGEKVEVIQEAK